MDETMERLLTEVNRNQESLEAEREAEKKYQTR
jgi:hypothetical protein